MSSDRHEDHGAERNQEHVADLARRVREHAREHDDERQEPRRGGEHEQSQRRADEPAALGDADAEHGHDHGAERCKAREVGDHLGEDAVQALEVHQVDGLDRGAGAGVLDRETERAEHAREHDDDEGEDREERPRVRQHVAEALDPPQHEVHPAAGRLRVVAHPVLPSRVAIDRSRTGPGSSPRLTGGVGATIIDRRSPCKSKPSRVPGRAPPK